MAVIAPGVPNIAGTIRTTTIKTSVASSGVFTSSYSGSSGRHEMGSDTADTTYDFDANRSSKVYGASSTVQAPALQLIYQIKF